MSLRIAQQPENRRRVSRDGPLDLQPLARHLRILPRIVCGTRGVYADAGWWRGDLWQYALYAVVAYARASAERRGDNVNNMARALAVARGVSVNS